MNLKHIRQLIFGQDIFISHRWTESSKKYALKLAEELENRGLDCFIDYNEIHAGDSIPTLIQLAIKRSKMFLLITHTDVLESVWISQEIKMANNGRRKIVPLNIANMIDKFDLTSPEWEDLNNRDRIEEPLEAFESGNPSPEVLREIDETFTARRNKARAAQYLFTLALIVSILTFGSTGMAMYVRWQARIETARLKGEAEQARIDKADADDAKNIAIFEREKAQEEKSLAEKDRDKFRGEKEIAETDRDKAKSEAVEQTKFAEAKARLADSETKRANEQTDKANKAEEREEIANRKATAEQLKARSNEARNYYNQFQIESQTNPLNALLWAQKALETAPKDDGNFEIYKFLTLNFTQYAPESVVNSGAHISYLGDKFITDENGKLTIRNQKTQKEFQYPLGKEGYVVSPDEKRVVWSNKKSNRVEISILDVESDIPRTENLPDYITPDSEIDFSPDSRAIIFKVPSHPQFYRKTYSVKLFVWKIDESEWIDLGETFVSREIKGNDHSLVLGGAYLPISQNPQHNRIITFRQDNEELFAIVKDIYKEKKEISIPLPANTDYVNFTPDAERIIFGSEDESTKKRNIICQSLESEKSSNSTVSFEVSSKFHIADTSNNGDKILLSGFDEIRLIDLKKDVNNPTVIKLDSQFVYDRAVFSKDEKYVVSKTYDSSNLTLKLDIFNAETGKKVRDSLTIPIEDGGFNIFPQMSTFGMYYAKLNKIDKQNLLPRTMLENVLPIEKLPVSGGKIGGDSYFSPNLKYLLTPEDRESMKDMPITLWDLSTGKSKWQDDSVEFIQDIGFHPKNENRYLLFVREKNVSPGYSITVRNLSNKEIINGFQKITGEFYYAVFSRDGSRIITLENESRWNGDKRNDFWVAKMWNAETGTYIESKDFLQTDERKSNLIGRSPLTLYGEYIISDEKQCELQGRVCSEFSLINTDPHKKENINLRFISLEVTVKAKAILKQAARITINADKSIKAEFGDKQSILISSRSDGTSFINRDLSSPLSNIFPSLVLEDNIRLSIDGKILLTLKRGKEIQFWETTTGLPLTKPIFIDEGVSAVTFNPNGKSVILATETGLVQEIYIGNFKEVPFWMNGMSQALTGMRLNDLVLEKIPQDEYMNLRKRFLENLRQAACNGDKDAQLVINNWQRGYQCKFQ